MRFSFCQEAIRVENGFTTSGATLTHSQFVNCIRAIRLTGSGSGSGSGTAVPLTVNNALMANVQYPFTVNTPASGNVLQHCTIHSSTRLITATASSGFNFVNSVLANVPSPLVSGSVSLWGSYNGFSPTDAVVFGSAATRWTIDYPPFSGVGGGAHYLKPDSEFREQGTTTISAGLLAALRSLTTDAPIELSADVAEPETLRVAARRSVEAPDLGYHYSPLDYLANGVVIQNATLRFAQGVAVGVAGSTGFRLRAGATLVGEGTPRALNRLARYSSVQEQHVPSLAGGPTGTLFAEDLASGAAPHARFRFTEFTLGPGCGSHFAGGARLGVLALTDCRVRGGGLHFNQAGSYGRTVALTNSIFERVQASLGTGSDATITAHARNNLFRFCTINLNAASANSWTWRDNLFDNTISWQYYGQVANSHNGYLNSNRLIPNSASDVLLGSVSYLSGPLGAFYQSAASPLRNKGSRHAGLAGLYHYTTQVDQSKDGTTTWVDIGAHYVATAADGKPVDSDGDGVPDYIEDANGNGVVDSGETDPVNPDSTGSGALDGELLAESWIKSPLSYTCRAIRDFFTPDRQRVLPDAQFNMEWNFNLPGYASHHGDFSECWEPNTPFSEASTDYQWPASGQGSLSIWDNAMGRFDQGPIDRPPTVMLPIPLERCRPFVFSMVPPLYTSPFTGAYSREARTKMGLYSGGPEWPKNKVGLVVAVTAVDKTGYGSLNPGLTGYELGEPDTQFVGQTIHPAAELMLVRGQRINADNQTLLQLEKDRTFDVSLDIPGCDWYQYHLNVARPKTVRFTWSRHPGVGASHAQVETAFENAARILATDWDELIPDDDPRLDQADPWFDLALYRHDSVPTYMDFIVFQGKRSVFPSSFPNPLNPPEDLDFTGAEYQYIESLDELKQLRLAQFANVKVVETLQLAGVHIWGYAEADCNPAIVMTRTGLYGQTVAHECGHAAGLLHRHNTWVPLLLPCDIHNWSTWYTVPHLMNPHGAPQGNSVNRHERDVFMQWQPGIWNE